jgi:hypothetical protein
MMNPTTNSEETELLYSEPFTGTVLRRRFASADEVEAAASDLLRRCREAGDILPGIELRSGGESMSIAVAPFGWALVHSDAEFDQHCTRNPNPDPAASGSHDVRWEEPDAVPGDWFVPVPQAMAAVRHWLSDGTLTSELAWSDDCI